MMSRSAVKPMGWVAFFLDAADVACNEELRRTGSCFLLNDLHVLLPAGFFHDFLSELEDAWPEERVASALALWNVAKVRAEREGLEEPYPFLFIYGVFYSLTPLISAPMTLWSNGRLEEL